MDIVEFTHQYDPIFPCTEETLLRRAGDMNTPLHTSEIHHSNDYYGIAGCIKNHVGLPPHYPLKAAMEHGLTLGTIWELDIAAPLPALFFVGRHRYAYLPPVTNKLLYAVGPAMAYANSAVEENVIGEIKKSLGKTLLAFPSHSTHWIDSKYDVESYCRHLENYRRLFDTVIVVLYWMDIVLGKHRAYLRRGFPCLCAGHMYDPQFLPRLKSIILLADSTCCARLTTGSAYCLLLNKPHFYDPVPYHDINFLEQSKILRTDVTDIQRQFQEVFAPSKDTLFAITEEQRIFGRDYMGLEDVKTPEELLAIFGLLEELTPYYQERQNTPDFGMKAARFLKSRGQPQLAALALRQLAVMSRNGKNGR